MVGRERRAAAGADESHNRIIGKFGESAAERHLTECGLRVIERNWRCRLGELDLVCFQGGELVVVEVKTRVLAPNAEKLLFETVTRAKQRRLIGLTTIYTNLLRRRGAVVRTVRIDIVGVLVRLEPMAASKIIHLKAAVSRS